MPMPPSDQRRAAPATWRTPRRSALRGCERIPSRRRAADASRRAALLLLAIAPGYASPISPRGALRGGRLGHRGFIHKLSPRAGGTGEPVEAPAELGPLLREALVLPHEARDHRGHVEEEQEREEETRHHEERRLVVDAEPARRGCPRREPEAARERPEARHQPREPELLLDPLAADQVEDEDDEGERGDDRHQLDRLRHRSPPTAVSARPASESATAGARPRGRYHSSTSCAPGATGTAMKA